MRTPITLPSADTLRCTLERTVNTGPITQFSGDVVGNLYTLRDDGTVVKYDNQGQKRTQFSQNRLGNLTEINATNALKLLLWYADFRTVLFLDRSLTQLGGALNLIDAGYPEVRALAPAADGNLWIYDEVNFKLRKISPEGAQLLESQDLNLLHGQLLAVHQIVDDGQQVLALDSTYGCFVFDVFGQFKKMLPLNPPVSRIFSDGQQVLGMAGGQICQTPLYLLAEPQCHTLLLKDTSLARRDAQLSPNRIWVVDSVSVSVWRF